MELWYSDFRAVINSMTYDLISGFYWITCIVGCDNPFSKIFSVLNVIYIMNPRSKIFSELNLIKIMNPKIYKLHICPGIDQRAEREPYPFHDIFHDVSGEELFPEFGV